ncbi:unnamed protein product [Closterium sp. NIES-54]
MVCGPDTGQQIRLGAYNVEDDAAYAYAAAAYVIRRKDHIPHMKVLTDTEMAALDGCVRSDVRHLVKARLWWRWRQWRTAMAEVGIAPGTPFPLENGGSRSPPISIGDDEGEYPLTLKDDAANEEMQEPELGRQDEEDAAEGESSRRRRKRNVNEVLQGSARQECEPEAPPAASSDDNPNEDLSRLNPVQSDDEDAAEAEDEEEAGADEEDAGAESWPDETPVTREEMTSLCELQEATARAIVRLGSDSLRIWRIYRMRKSGVQAKDGEKDSDAEAVPRGLAGARGMKTHQRIKMVWFPSLWNDGMRAFVRCCAQVTDAIRNWEARKGCLSNSAGCNAHIMDGLHVLVKSAVTRAIAEFRPEYDAASHTWAWGRHGLRISADGIAGGKTASAQASASLGTPQA